MFSRLCRPFLLSAAVQGLHKAPVAPVAAPFAHSFHSRVCENGTEIDPALATVSLFDDALLRGDGVFEVVRIRNGKPFGLRLHARRYVQSAQRIGLETPGIEEMEKWSLDLLEGGDDCILRWVTTRGSSDKSIPSKTFVIKQQRPYQPPTFTLFPVSAGWHPGKLGTQAIGPVKWLSYAPNMAATRLAVAEGCNDALLVRDDGTVLEGPTFAVAWVRNGVLETPAEASLHLLESVTRQYVLTAAKSLGITVNEVELPMSELSNADEIMVMSSTRDVSPVTAVGDIIPPVVGAPEDCNERKEVDRSIVPQLKQRFYELIDAENLDAFTRHWEQCMRDA